MKGSTKLPRLYAIIDVAMCQRRERQPLDVCRAFLQGGARLLQLRAKTLASGALLDLAVTMVEEARAVRAMVIVNDRADLAVVAGAPGVHVGQEDLAPAEVRRVTGQDAVVGLSTHTSQQVTHAIDEPISYLAIGPVFGTATKASGYEAVGYGAVQRAARLAGPRGLPVVAIGGITLATAPQLIEAGAASVAIIADLLVGDSEARVRQYLSVLA